MAGGRLLRGFAYTYNFLMIDSADHITGKTGATVTVSISKAGATGAAPSGGATATQVDSTNHPGLYKIALSATDTNTRGDLAVHAAATGCDPFDRVEQVEEDGIYHGTVTSTGTTTTLIDSALTQAGTNWWVGRVVIFTLGSTLAGQGSPISGFTPATDTVTLTNTLTAAPQVGDTYIIV